PACNPSGTGCRMPSNCGFRRAPWRRLPQASGQRNKCRLLREMVSATIWLQIEGGRRRQGGVSPVPREAGGYEVRLLFSTRKKTRVRSASDPEESLELASGTLPVGAFA